MSKARRIHHRERLKKARRRYWGRDLSLEPEMLAKAIACPKRCACWICSGTRKHEGATLKERLSAEEMRRQSPYALTAARRG